MVTMMVLAKQWQDFSNESGLKPLSCMNRPTKGEQLLKKLLLTVMLVSRWFCLRQTMRAV
ncbi:hypothetical protein NS331_24350 [Pseudacidovorax intermedius]|uniref:Uncharacterized protein n=1 Tax=Pseudacidovorax intermedius TaxID=433924 RepID=A0A147GLL8_9BURK|nr:hypothetical protein NS331_24350 [Pseudacidovorax intermedius]